MDDFFLQFYGLSGHIGPVQNLSHLWVPGAIVVESPIFSKKNVTKNGPISTIFEIEHRETAHLKALLILLKKGRVTFFDRTNGFLTNRDGKK